MVEETDDEMVGFMIAKYFGIMSSVCFALQYVPQMWLNFRRKSVKGFSTYGIIIKLIGASFLLVNSYLNGETFPVIFYGLVNVVQHSIFILHFYQYNQTYYTNFKLKVCYDLKTTSGISLLSQHFNIIGGLLGVYMCYIIPPVSSMTYLIYLNSIGQALSLYAMTAYYDFYLASPSRKGAL